MTNTEFVNDAVQSLQERIGDGLLAVALGDVRSLEFEPAYVRDDAGETWETIEEFFSDETQKEIFEKIAAEAFFKTEADGNLSPLGRLSFTVRYYEEAIIVIGWLDSDAVLVTLRPTPEYVSPTVEVLQTTMQVDSTE